MMMGLQLESALMISVQNYENLLPWWLNQQ
jgi:hypothetical protein